MHNDNVMRVLFANHVSKMGGAEQVLLSVLRSFGSESTLWLFEDGPLRRAVEAQGSVGISLPPRQAGFAAIRRDAGLLAASLPLLRQMAVSALAMARAARGADMVYANSQKAFVLAAVAARLARRPLVWHLHDILTPAHFGAAQLRLLRMLAPWSARIIVPSAAAAGPLVGVRALGTKVRVVPNGVSLPPDTMSAAERRARRCQLGIPRDAPLIGVFSRLSPWKGQAVVLQALPPGMHCLIVGDALFGEAEYARSLRRMVAELGLRDRVHFLGHRDDVPALMRMVDVMVHPSVDPEPFGRTLVEAMLCEVPVIATDAGAAREILADGRAGLLVAPGSAPEIARALAQTLADPAATAARVAAARQRALEHYTEQAMRDGICAVLREVHAARR